jgi:membrane associated rhomboid family serine protease
MANCPQCNRELPPFAAGRGSSACPHCRAMADLPPAEVRYQPAPEPVAASSGPGTITVTSVLLGINCAVFGAMALSGVSLMDPTLEQLLKWGANWGPLSLGSQPWRMLASTYVHIGIIHIALNMWCLWGLGKLAERIFDWWTYVLVYTACGLAGSLASLWWHPMVVGAGASGAIFGLAGALIGVLYLGKLPISKEAVRGTMKSLLTFTGYNLFFGLRPGVDNSAHVGGLLAGVALGAVLAKHVTAPPEIRRDWTRFALIGMAVVLLGGTVALRRHDSYFQTVGNIQYSDVELGPAAIKAFQEGNYEEALPGLKRLVDFNPKSAQAHYLLGVAYYNTHRASDAIASFQRALELDPDYADAEAGLGMAYKAQGMQQQADEAFKKAEELKANGAAK